eukprot:Partr_v1_DN26667_c0_g1_i1_m68912
MAEDAAHQQPLQPQQQSTAPPDIPLMDQLKLKIRSLQFARDPGAQVELVEITDYMMRDFVLSWYTWISSNTQFPMEILPAWSLICRRIEARLMKYVDSTQIACMDLPIILDQHLADFKTCREKLGSGYSGGYKIEELFLLHQPHIAMDNQNSELIYISGIVDQLLKFLLSPEELKSLIVTTCLREILAALLVNLANNLSAPQTIYNILFNVVTRRDSELRKRFRQLHDLGSSREFEMMRGLERVRSMKTAATILDSLLTTSPADGPSSDAPVSNVAASEGDLSSSAPRSNPVMKDLRGHNRSSSTIVRPADRTQVSPTSHPLAMNLSLNVSDSAVNRIPPRRQSVSDISELADKQSLIIGSMPRVSSSSESVTDSSGLRPRSNATHFTKKSSNKSPNLDEKSSQPASIPHNPPFYTHLPTITIDKILLWLAFLWIILVQYASAFLNTFILRRGGYRRHEYQLDEHWYKFVSRLMCFRTSPSPLYLFIDIIFRPLTWFMFGNAMERSLEGTAHILVEPAVVCIYLRQLKNVLWPNGKLLDHPPPVVIDKDELIALLSSKIPAVARAVIQERRVNDSVETLVDMFSYHAINKRLVYSLLDLIVKRIVLEKKPATPTSPKT